MVKKCHVKAVKLQPGEILPPCQVCIQGKFTALPFPKREERSETPLQLVYSDICGPMRTRSNGGGLYFATFIDDYSRWCEVYILKKKSEIFTVFKEYKNLVENQLNLKIKTFQSDNAREYISGEFNKFLKNQGIQRRFTAPYTPQQNGVAERKNRTLVEMARCMIIQSGVPPSFWGEAICTANFIRNRCPTATLLGGTPYEWWTNKKPNLNFLRTFGETTFVLNKGGNPNKLKIKSSTGIFVGYSPDTKTYRIYMLETRKIYRTRDVSFQGKMHYKPHGEDIISTYTKSGDQQLLPEDIQDEIDELEETEAEVAHRRLSDLDRTTQSKRGRGRPKTIRTGKPGRPSKSYNMVPVEPITYIQTRSLTSSMRSTATTPTTPADPQGLPDIRITEDMNDVFLDPATEEGVNDDKVVAYAFNAEIYFKEAIKGSEKDEWTEAITNEMKSLIEHETWELVIPPKDRNIVGCRYVLTNKYLPNGKLDKRNARLVAQGYTQEYQVDYTEKFAPVARLTSIRLLLAVAVKYNMVVEQIDITIAFLNGTLKEIIYMKNPPLIEEILEEIIKREPRSGIANSSNKMLQKLRESKGESVCLLKGALYGLKQAELPWNIEVNNVLIRMGLQRSKSDPCMYFAWKGKQLLLISVYVDDFLISSHHEKWIAHIKHELSTYFNVKDRGKAKYCLGLEIHQSPGIITVKQTSYLREIIKRFKMEDANAVSTPLPVGKTLTEKEKEDSDTSRIPYRELVGALMYAAVATRPDIADVVSFLAQFNHCYTEKHWGMTKRVFRYLIGTKNLGLCYERGDKTIEGYVDADWAGCLQDRKSYTGYAFTLSNAAISWKSQKQKTVALSSTEAEYMGIAEGVKEAVYWSNYMREIELMELTNLTLYNDNQGARLLTDNPILHQRTKHIDIKYYFIRDIIKGGKNQDKLFKHE